MSNLARRIDALTKRLADDRATVFLFSWQGDAPISTANYGEHTLRRMPAENDDEFADRVTAWARAFPGKPCSVWLGRG